MTPLAAFICAGSASLGIVIGFVCRTLVRGTYYRAAGSAGTATRLEDEASNEHPPAAATGCCH